VQAQGLISVFPTKTFPNHYSIATGLYPENSGLVGNTMFDPLMQQWYRIRDREAVQNPDWYKGEPIWNTAEKQGLRAGTMFWVGSEAPIQDMRPSHWKLFDGDMPFKARIDTVVRWLSDPDSSRSPTLKKSGEVPVDFATLYFENVDKAGHEYGLDSDSLRQAIRQSDRLLGYLKSKMQKQKIWESTNIIILSDHGMVELSADKTIPLDQIINPDDAERMVWAPATMIQPKTGKKDTMYQALKREEKNYSVYKKEDLPERYHIKKSPRVPEIVMVADAGYTFLRRDYKKRFMESLPSATHGYDPSDKQMQALFAARGPAFKEGKNVAAFQNIHIYELMAHLLKLKPAPNDGSIDSVKVLLK
jgi:predicted AlkP superfamily pyrophosphatase or phosphodiesterase